MTLTHEYTHITKHPLPTKHWVYTDTINVQIRLFASLKKVACTEKVHKQWQRGMSPKPSSKREIRYNKPSTHLLKYTETFMTTLVNTQTVY